jgi:hypothetical protein
VNDQHPPYKPGDRVTLVDTRSHPCPVPLVIASLAWDTHDGDWYATCVWPNGTGRITRRVGWLTRGWPA